MRKNFLNAILFGGLIALSAGSFVACSDYDDDINGLQKQIDSVNTTLAALQTQVNAGRWVTTLTSVDGGFSVVFSDGSTYDIVNGKDGATGATGATGAAGSVLTIESDGYWYIDGVKTEYKAEIDYSKLSYVKDGFWNIGGEQTDYKAVGNTYAIKDADGVWTLYVPGEDGEIKEVELPTAAAMVTSIKVIDAKGYDKYLSLDNTTFTYSGSTNWDGATLPEDGSRIMASNNKVLLQITPAEAAAGIKEITLVNSKGEALGFNLAANAYTGLLTRAAIANGLYELSIPAQAVDDEKYKALEEALKGEDSGSSAMFGFAVDGVLRSDYDFATSTDGETGNNSLGTKLDEVSYYDASTGADSDDNALYIKPLSGDDKIALGSSEASSIGTAKTGEAITIGFSNSYIYDAYLTFDDATKEAFGITYDKTSDHQTFTVGKLPDEGSLTVKFTLTTVDVLGNVKTTALSTAVAVEGNDVTIKNEDGSGAVDLSEEKPQIVIALEKNGINTTFWKNHCATVGFVGLYSDAACTKAATDKATATTAYFSTADKTKVESAKEATHITVNIDKSGIRKMSGDYYLKLVSKSSDGIELGAIVVPVQLKADPTNSVKSLIADNLNGKYPETDGFIVISSGYNIVNQAFDGSEGTFFGVNLTNYISGLEAIERGSGTGDNIASSCSVKIGDTAVTFALDGADKSVAMINGKTAATSDVASFYTNPKGGAPWLLLKNELIYSDGKTLPYLTEKKDSIQAGYGKDLIIKATTEDGESYSFKVRIESPIASGKLKVKNAGASFMDGDYVGAVTFDEDNLEDGGTEKIYSDQIKLFAVNDSNPYDVIKCGSVEWGGEYFMNENISDVKFGNGRINRIKFEKMQIINNDSNDPVEARGYVEYSKSDNFSNPNDDWFPVTVSDKFGYTRIWEVQTMIKKPRKAPTD